MSSRIKKIKRKTKGKTVMRTKEKMSVTQIKKDLGLENMSHDEILQKYEENKKKVRQCVIDSINKYGEKETVERLIEELGEFFDYIDEETGEKTTLTEKEKRLWELMIKEDSKLTEQDKKELRLLYNELYN